MSRLHLRTPSPALVVSLVALVAALGGTSYAAFSLPKNSVGTKQLKNKAVTSSKIKNGAVTSSKINTSGLTVPNASHANSADNATNATNATNANHATSADSATNAGHATSADNATNATSVDGMQLTSFTYAAANGSTKSTVVNGFDGLTLKASCTSGANNGLTVYGNSATTGATVSWTGISEGGTSLAGGHAENNSFGSMTAGTDMTLMAPGTGETTNGSVNIGFSVGQIVYSQPGGSRVTVDWSYGNNIAGNACYWTGTAVGAPSGPSSSARHAGGSSSGSTLSDAQLARARG
jgi:hypothetical protein